MRIALPRATVLVTTARILGSVFSTLSKAARSLLIS